MRRAILQTVYHAARQDVAAGNSNDSFSFSAVFSEIIDMFLNLLSTKDEEISMLRTRPMEREPVFLSDDSSDDSDDSEELEDAYDRIHDLVEATEQQRMYYLKMLETMQKTQKSPPVASTPTPVSMISIQDNETVQQLQMKVDSLNEDIQATKDDMETLETENRNCMESV